MGLRVLYDKGGSDHRFFIRLFFIRISNELGLRAARTHVRTISVGYMRYITYRGLIINRPPKCINVDEMHGPRSSPYATPKCHASARATSECEAQCAQCYTPALPLRMLLRPGYAVPCSTFILAVIANSLLDVNTLSDCQFPV